MHILTSRLPEELHPRQFFAENDGRDLSKGVVVDTETTGTIPDKDAIVELVMVKMTLHMNDE